MLTCATLKESLAKELPSLYTCSLGETYLTVYTPYWLTPGEAARVFVRPLNTEGTRVRVTDRAEASKWLAILGGDDAWVRHYYEIEAVAHLYALKLSSAEALYVDASIETLPSAIERVAQAAKDVVAFRLMAGTVADEMPEVQPARQQRLLVQVKQDIRRFFPDVVIEKADIAFRDASRKLEKLALDAYVADTKTIIQTIRGNNEEKAFKTMAAFIALTEHPDEVNAPPVEHCLVVLDKSAPEMYKMVFKKYATVIERDTSTQQDTEAYRRKLEPFFAQTA